MDFMEAVKAMKKGKIVRQSNWENKNVNIFMKEDGWFKYCGKVNQNYLLDLSDIEATDWEIYEEEDNWNLAKDGHIHFDSLDSIRTFIQKCKEEVININKRDHIDKIQTDELFEIIDKRAGDL